MKTKIRLQIVLQLLFVSLMLTDLPCFSQALKPGWPTISNEMKPWSRWWWMGSAVNPSDLKAAMEAYSQAGLGGLEVTAIYGVHGYEKRFVKFLSPEWINNFNYTLKEGKRLDLGIDLAMASGWPFGGIWVTPEDACKYMAVQKYSLKGGEQLQEKVLLTQKTLLNTISRKKLDISQLKYPVNANADSLQNWSVEQVRYPIPMPLQSLMAYSSTGETLNLSSKLGADGKLDWTAPAGDWKLYAVFQGWHGKMVERAGPGGEGDVIDHFSTKAIDHYLGHFTSAFQNQDLSGLRSYFNDSYEVDDARGQSDFTPLLFEDFQKRRGYDLRLHLPALMGDDSPENNQRVLCDYRETISDLILENYTQRWHDWAARGGKQIRNQAHGAPANILDLYAAADIPETEGEDIVKVKTASSVAHVMGKKLASSESATWLRDHFEASLSDVKQNIDMYLLAGINHVFYHGTTFSPQDAPWPGWMFYAAVHFGPTNTIWKDFGSLNAYISRCQSFLQAGKPNNDILLYYPIQDEYAVRGKALLLHFDGAAKGTEVRKIAEDLYSKGYAFDYISDRQVLQLNNAENTISTGGTSYQTLLMPSIKLMPLNTFEKVIDLAKNGACILMEQLPEDVPGWGNLNERRAKFKELKNALKFEAFNGKVQRAKIGKGEIILGALNDLLTTANIRRESMYDQHLQCIRRSDGKLSTYFIVNRGTAPIDGMVPFQTKIGTAILYHPMTAKFGKAITKSTATSNEVYLKLNPGESCLLQISPENVEVGNDLYLSAAGAKQQLSNEWTLSFLSGGPNLPKETKLKQLGSWTDLDGEEYKAFSGTASYRTQFAKPSGKAGYYRLDLGAVAHSAKVILNGKEVATLIIAPFTVDLPAKDLKRNNTLEIQVTNLMGNRMADMERKGQAYKIFYNTNFPARDAINRGKDGLFTTEGWKPQISGLLGPVSLMPLQKMKQ